jgi:DNA transposition AAA+ family ATPase
MYTENQKLQAVELLKSKLKSDTNPNGLSQNGLGTAIGISGAYMSKIMNGEWQIREGKSEISEATWKKIFVYLNFGTDVWDIDNYIKVQNVLLEAKSKKEHRIISGLKGTGKTFSATEIKKKYAAETYIITCSEDMNPKAFMVELANLMGVTTTGDRRTIRMAISEKIKLQSNTLIIIDEAENLKNSTYGSIKALYDQVHEYAGIVLIGANHYLENLQKKAKAGKGCFPQLYSRFSAEPATLAMMGKEDVRSIANLNGITDRESINRLYDISTDYRELDRNIKRHLRDIELQNKAT